MKTRTLAAPGLLAAVLILLIGVCEASPDEAVVKLLISPAQPATTRTVMEVVKKDGKCTVMVQRVDVRERREAPKPVPVSITPEEFDRIWSVIEHHRLHCAEARCKYDGDDKVADYGMRRLSIEWSTGSAGNSHIMTWGQPITAEDGFHALYGAIDALNTRKAEQAAGATCPSLARFLIEESCSPPNKGGFSFELIRDGESCKLAARRIGSGRGDWLPAESYVLSQREFARLWKILVDKGFLDFPAKLEFEERPVADHSSYKLVAEWTDEAGTVHRHEKSWGQPVIGESELAAFATELSLVESRNRMPADGPVLVHLQEGDVLTFNRTRKGAVEEVYTYTILEVHPAGVYYELRDPADSLPVRVLWRWEPDPEDVKNSMKAGDKFSFEGMFLPFDTMVLETSRGRSKKTQLFSRLLGKPSFPPCVRTQQGSRVEELVSITHAPGRKRG